MDRIREFIHEVHRRSIWQVMGIFIAASWGVLQVVEVLTETAGLPDWTPSMALVLLLIGFPVCVATAFVQEGMPGKEPSVPERAEAATAETSAPDGRWLTWKNAILGGVGTMALLGFSLVAYFVMWSTGIGPVGNLQAQGLIEEGEPVLLADFANRTGDPALGDVVTEALRVDLARTRAITLVEEASVRELLGLMGREPDTRVEGSVAEEISVRGGYGAIIEGEVGGAGSGYILVASLRRASDGETLATFRRTAENEGQVISAIDGLSQDIRERAGESLRSIRGDEPLAAVTTSSLEALKMFTNAREASEQGDQIRALSLIDEALALDPEFAMAWRGRSVILSNQGGDRVARGTAARRAYELRHRLTDRERLKTIAQFHREVTGDLAAEISAYESLLDSYPDDQAGLNNLAIAYSNVGRMGEAVDLLERAIAGPAASFSNYTNLPMYHARAGNFEEAREAQEELETRYPGAALWVSWAGFVVAWSEWDADEARRRAVDLQGVPEEAWRRTGTRALALAYGLTGQHGAMRETFEGAVREAQRAGDHWSTTQGWTDMALAEELHGAGDAREPLQALLESGVLDRMPPAARSNVEWIPILAWHGFHEEARRLLGEWADEAGEAGSTRVREIAALIEAFDLGRDDPAEAAAAIERLRTAKGCETCWMWEVGTLYERAGELDAALTERLRSSERGQNVYFGSYRLAAHESLGRIYEALGDTAKAVEHYTIYAEQLRHGDALPRVQRARERIAALATPTP